MSKKEQVAALVAENPNMSRKDMIALIMTKFGMSDAGASTYHYNATKGAKKAAPAAKVDPLVEAAKNTKKAAKTKADDEQPVKAASKEMATVRKEIDTMLEKIDFSDADVPDFLKRSRGLL